MSAALHRMRSRFGHDDGYSLPEILVGLMIGVLVVATAGTMVITLVRSQPAISGRAAQIQQGRTMVETVGRELRQGESIVAASSSALTLLPYVHTGGCGAGPSATTARLCRVSYSCGVQSCARTERNPDGTGSAPARQVVRGISGPNVFSYQPAPGTSASFVGIELV